MVNASDRPGRPPGAMRGARRALLGAALLGLGACSYMPSMPSVPGASLFAAPTQIRGNIVEQEDLGQVVVGVSSRSDVQALLGSPSATGTFDEREWYYIGGVTRQRPGRQLALDDQQVVAIRFDDRGTVQDIRRLGAEDGRPVQMVERITPSPGNERTFLQQLFGNIGRLGPGLSNQAPTGPGPTSTPR
jgi:outer membrane protein assembly factor BamE (lipoprotein component of BamABCDE complex)